jgi:hypothetical protein
MIRKIFIITAIIFQIAFGESSNIPGAFTDVGYSAKSISMGLVQSNLNQGAMSSILNPASLLNQEGKHSLAVNSFKLRNMDNYLVLAYSTRLIEKIPIGVMIITSGDEIWAETQIGLSVGYQILEGLNVGLTTKLLNVSAGNNEDGQIQIGDSGELQVSGSGIGFGLDFGVQYQLSENQQFAMVFKNLLNTIGYSSEGGGGNAEGDYSEGIPSEYILGYRISNKSVTVLMDIVDGFGGEYPAEMRLGSDWNLFKKDMLFLRSGIRTELMTGENTMYGLGAGVNLNPGNIGLELNFGYFFRPNFVGMNELRIEFGLNLN